MFCFYFNLFTICIPKNLVIICYNLNSIPSAFSTTTALLKGIDLFIICEYLLFHTSYINDYFVFLGQ